MTRYTCTHQGSREPLGRLIYLLSRDLRNFAEKILNPYDITMEQLNILKFLMINNHMTQREIGDAVSKSPANTTRILDRLEAKGLTVRKQNPQDRRASQVSLTEKGNELVDEVMGVFDLISAQLIQGVTDDEDQVVRQVFKKLTRNITNINQGFGSERQA